LPRQVLPRKQRGALMNAEGRVGQTCTKSDES
jgi:hypothetical protein